MGIDANRSRPMFLHNFKGWYRMLDFGMHHGDERASQGHERLQYLGKILLLCAQ